MGANIDLFLIAAKKFLILTTVMLGLTLKALKNSHGSASIVAILTITVAVASIVVSISVASGFRESLTQAVISSEGDYWLECRDKTMLSRSSAQYDSALVSRLYEYGASKVEGRVSADVIALTYDGAFPLEFRSLSGTSGISISESLHAKLGDTLDIISSMKIPFAFPVRVDSVYRCDISEISGMVCYAPSEIVSRFRGVDSDAVDGYVVWGSDIENISYAICDEPIWIYDSKDRFAGIFDWLDVIDGNVWLVVIIMMTVAAVNMIAALLATILENTRTIALLKSIGMSMAEIRRGVVVKSISISIIGSVSGFVIAVAVCLLQLQFGIVKLSPDDYMLSAVPIHLSLLADVAVMFGAVVLVTLFSFIATVPVGIIKEDTILRYE